MGNNPINLIDPDGGCTSCPKNGKVGDVFNHPEYGNVSLGSNGYWSTADGVSILNDVVVMGGVTKSDLFFLQGIAQTAHFLNHSPQYFDFNTYTEKDKQNIFKTSAEKTIAVMLWERLKTKNIKKIKKNCLIN